MHLAEATPFLHQPECHPQASSRFQLLLPPSLLFEPPQLPQRGRRPGWRRAENRLLPGRLPPSIPWAWWMKPSPSRTSSKPLLRMSAWQPSAKLCPGHQKIGRPGCLIRPRRKLAARHGARAKVAVIVGLHCHHLCPQLRVLSSPLVFLAVIGPCLDSGSHRGQWQRSTWGVQCPPLSTGGPWEHRPTNLCTVVTLGVGSGRKLQHFHTIYESNPIADYIHNIFNCS